MHQKLNKKTGYAPVARVIILLLSLLVFLALTQPEELPLLLLLVPFVLVYLLFYQLTFMLVSKFNRRKSRNFIIGSSACLAALPTVVLLLSSLDQLSVVDLIVMLLLIIGVFLYIQYVDFFKSE